MFGPVRVSVEEFDRSAFAAINGWQLGEHELRKLPPLGPLGSTVNTLRAAIIAARRELNERAGKSSSAE